MTGLTAPANELAEMVRLLQRTTEALDEALDDADLAVHRSPLGRGVGAGTRDDSHRRGSEARRAMHQCLAQLFFAMPSANADDAVAAEENRRMRF